MPKFCQKDLAHISHPQKEMYGKAAIVPVLRGLLILTVVAHQKKRCHWM